MPTILWDNFGGGLDRRRLQHSPIANALWSLTNCYVTKGKSIKKRPCLHNIAGLEAGTKGLRAAAGKLNTFFSADGVAITHADTRFVARRVRNQGAASPVAKIHYAELFNGYLYVSAEYVNGTVEHHYLDEQALTAWAPGVAISLNSYRRPTVSNGYRYQATSISGTGTTGGLEPNWPLTPGGTVTDNPGPNQVVWTCLTYKVVDANCPHGKYVKKIGQKLYSNNGSNVRFCAATDARDWTTTSDAGFIPSDIHASGSDTVTGLGSFGGDLAIFYADSTQIWTVASAPANNALKGTADQIGTLHGGTPISFAGDLLFLAQEGFRTISIAVLTNNLQESDSGTPIDAFRSEIDDADDPSSVYFPKLGQVWCVNGSRAYVLSYSKTAKLSAWAIFDFPSDVSTLTVLDNSLYCRSSNTVYEISPTATSDDGIPPLCYAEMFFQDNKAPGLLKQFIGFDAAGKGTFSASFKYDSRNPSWETAPYAVTADSRPDGLSPMEVAAVSVAPVISHEADEDFELSLLQTYYEVLGPL